MENMRDAIKPDSADPVLQRRLASTSFNSAFAIPRWKICTQVSRPARQLETTPMSLSVRFMESFPGVTCRDLMMQR